MIVDILTQMFEGRFVNIGRLIVIAFSILMKLVKTLKLILYYADCDTHLSNTPPTSGKIETYKYNTYALNRAQCNWFISGGTNDVITFQ